MALYRGPFLHGFYLRGASGFEDWMLREQTRLEQAVIEALQRLLESSRQAGAGDPLVGIRYARRLLDLDPLHEATHRLLIELLARAGQRTAALAQYDQCARVLDADLGSAPEVATTELAERIRSGRWEPPAPAAPAQVAPLLLRGLTGADATRRGEIYTALAHLRAADLPLDTAPLGALLLDEIRTAYEAVVLYADLLPNGADALLHETLDRRWRRGLERIAMLLDVLYAGVAVGGLRRPLPGSADSPPGPGAAARLAGLPDAALAELLLPLLIGSAEMIIAGAAARFGLARTRMATRFAQLAADADPWLRACALFRIGELGLRELRDLAHAACRSDDALVRETAQHTVLALQEAG